MVKNPLKENTEQKNISYLMEGLKNSGLKLEKVLLKKTIVWSTSATRIMQNLGYKFFFQLRTVEFCFKKFSKHNLALNFFQALDSKTVVS